MGRHQLAFYSKMCLESSQAVYNRVEHEAQSEIASSAVAEELVTIEELHCRMGHITPAAAKVLVKNGMVEGFTLKYGKAHRKAILKVHEKDRLKAVGIRFIQACGDPCLYRRLIAGNIMPHSLMIIPNILTSICPKARTKPLTLTNPIQPSSPLNTTSQSKKYIQIVVVNTYPTSIAAGTNTKHNHTVHDTPERNGVSKRLNLTILVKVCAMLNVSSLPKFL